MPAPPSTSCTKQGEWLYRKTESNVFFTCANCSQKEPTAGGQRHLADTI
jgi:hypothetical protein